MKALGRLTVFVAVVAAFGFLANHPIQQPAGTAAPTKLPSYTGGTDVKADPWSYSVDPDSMSSKVERRARIASSNAFEFGFPYQGPQHSILVLRTHPRYGKDVMLQIVKGQFMCGVSGCTVNVRFDDGPAQRWPAAEPADNDSTVLFLRNYDAFVAKLAKAKLLRVEPTFFKEGNVMMEFPVAGFSAEKYSGK